MAVSIETLSAKLQSSSYQDVILNISNHYICSGLVIEQARNLGLSEFDNWHAPWIAQILLRHRNRCWYNQIPFNSMPTNLYPLCKYKKDLLKFEWQSLQRLGPDNQMAQVVNELTSAHFYNSLVQHELACSLETKSLASSREVGIKISVDKNAFRTFAFPIKKENLLIEAFKRAPILKTDNFDKLFLSVLSHDIVDHLLYYDIGNESGLFEAYKDFLSTMGSPHQRNIFSRESEIFSGIVLGWRSFNANLKPKIRCNVTLEGILDLLNSNKSENSRRAIKVIQSKSTEPMYRSMLGFVFTRQYSQQLTTFHNYGIPLLGDCLELFSLANSDYCSLAVETLFMLENFRPLIEEILFKSLVILEYILTLALSNSYIEVTLIPRNDSLNKSMFEEARLVLGDEKLGRIKASIFNQSISF